MSRVKERIADFLAMGVREVWMFDPQRRKATVWAGTTTVEHATGQLGLAGTPIVLDVGEVFAALDEE